LGRDRRLKGAFISDEMLRTTEISLVLNYMRLTQCSIVSGRRCAIGVVIEL